MHDAIQNLFDIRRDERVPVALAMVFFFCVLVALMVLRPARDALGLQRGMDTVRWLFVGTALVTLLANPAFGWLVSRFRRLLFIAATYLGFVAALLGFWLLLVFAPGAVGEASGLVFYVWYSVSNLFLTMVFWALMADAFTLEQARRCFALVTVGGTLGATCGPLLAALLAEPLGTPALLLVSAAFLLLALVFAALLSRHTARHGTAGRAADRAILGGSAWQGLRAVFRSPYLGGIAGYVVLMTIMATFIYFTRLQLVSGLGPGVDLRAGVFARIDLLTQVTTLLLQALVAGRVMKRVGVAATLALLPALALLGFLGLALVGTLAALVAFEAGFRAVQRAFARPARETLYTVVGREDKYKSKAFIDTFVYRGGDVVGAQVQGGLAALGLGLAGLAALAVPLALAWGALGLWLGRRQQTLAAPAQDARFTSVATTGGTP